MTSAAEQNPNIAKAVAALVVAVTALEKAYEDSEYADHDYVLEAFMGEINGIGSLLAEQDLSEIAVNHYSWEG